MFVAIIKLFWLIFCFFYLVAINFWYIFTGIGAKYLRDSTDDFAKLLLGWNK